jgi:hypothetical protein
MISGRIHQIHEAWRQSGVHGNNAKITLYVRVPQKADTVGLKAMKDSRQGIIVSEVMKGLRLLLIRAQLHGRHKEPGQSTLGDTA